MSDDKVEVDLNIYEGFAVKEDKKSEHVLLSPEARNIKADAMSQSMADSSSNSPSAEALVYSAAKETGLLAQADAENVFPLLFNPARRFMASELEQAMLSGNTERADEIREAHALMEEAIAKVIGLTGREAAFEVVERLNDDLVSSLKECTTTLEALSLQDVDVDPEMLDRAKQAIRASEQFSASLTDGGQLSPDYVSYGPEEWGLYDVPGAENAAQEINGALNSGIATFYTHRALGIPHIEAMQVLQQRISGKLAKFGDCGGLDDWVQGNVQRVIREVILDAEAIDERRAQPAAGVPTV